ncbi:relative of woc [Lasioglossum baleicum]|uniref:relative of woc n=1 Tax=Lasioglossum baleicum TaxID=434251 RepID=UPI003FCCA623
MVERRCACFSLSAAFHLFGILGQCLRSECLTIDNRIAIPGNDCYARISVGSKLSDTDIVSRLEVTDLTECEEQCSRSERICNSFTFGVGVKGNGTCALSTRVPDLDDLKTDPDYDVYVKRRQNSLWCIRNVALSYGSLPTKIAERPNTKEDDAPDRADASSPRKPIKPVSSTFFRSFSIPRVKNDYGKVNHGPAGIYNLFIDHDGRFLSGDDNRSVLDDILANKNQKKASNSPLVVTCHRKLQPGKKTMEPLIERVVDCENVQDCQRACEHEKTFDCKGFNYRHETNGSKSTCELTATPYLHMNANKDFLIDSRYDYYERDRNCMPFKESFGGSFPRRNRPTDSWSQIEQHNTDTDLFRQQSIPTDFSLYQTMYPTSQQSTPDLFDKHAPRFNEQFPREGLRDYGFRQNVPSDWYGNERNPESGPVRGNSFHDFVHNGFSNVKSSMSPPYEIDEKSLQRDSFYARNNEQSSEKLYNYGSAFGYDDSYLPNIVTSSKDYGFGEREATPTGQRCSITYATGSKLGRNVLRKSCLARDPKQCEQLCLAETAYACGSFAYRYNVLSTNPTDNCLLSDLSHKDLNSYTDLEPDRDYDVYIMIQDPKVCYSKEETSRPPAEECFSRVRSGFGIPTDITRKSTLAHNMGECQFACTTSQDFLCKSFVFVYGTVKQRDRGHTNPNCFLSDWTSGEIDPVNMPDMDGAELYERSSFSYGCGAYPSVPSVSELATFYEKGSVSTQSDELCYARYHRPCKLMPPAIVSSARTPTRSECRQRCSSMRNTGTIPCMSFNYMRANTDGTQHNCWLSDISIQDLRPNLDYTHDDNHVLYMWKDLEPFCGLSTNPLYETNITPINKDRGQLPPASFPPTLEQPNPQIVFDDRTHGTGPIFDSDPRTRNQFQPGMYGHDHERENGHETDHISNVGNPGVQPPSSYDRFEPGLDSPFHFHSRTLSTFQRYTVSGHPCRNGTLCQRNEVAGFWSCEIEGNSEQGSWNYCCEPDHKCGYSQGYEYPWCYVGLKYDQWRPCSETYYPYVSKDLSFYRQFPAYSARHWPVIYQHETVPSECVGNATERRSFHEINYITKMPKTRLITRSVTNTRPSHMTLNLECAEEPLSEAQLMLRLELKENYDRVAATLDELIKDHGGKLVCQAGNVNGYQYTLPSNSAPTVVKNPQSIVGVNQTKNQQPIKLNVLNNANGSQSNIQLVVDSRMGVILGSVAQSQVTSITTAPSVSISAPPTTPASTSTSIATTIPTITHSQTENYKYTRSGRRTKVLQPQQPDIIEEPVVVARGRQKVGSSTHVVTPTTTSPQGVTNLRIKTVSKQQITPVVSSTVTTINANTGTATTSRLSMTKPTEHTSIGGISVGNKNAACEQIEESKKNLPDGREVTFNKMNGGRTFPSLVVVARPNLRTKDITAQVAQKERSELDIKVKSVLMFSATKFAEWLIQQGLVKSEQYCAQHSNNYQKTKLKLGMYSDQGTFPYSGGYVWISSCCPDRYVSVFSGSIFQGAPYTPTVLLKLIYHWACQTSVQNVVSWVKVTNVYVKNFYTHLRSICTAAVWDKTRKMGGKNSVIQVGVISLGTTSQDGNLRQVKVEVLGVLDYATMDLRLRACDPVQDGDRSYKRRFNNILHPLKDWVHTDSKIMTDFTVDKSTLEEMGFTCVTQSAFSEQNPRNLMSNSHIMEYLRKIVPRMFQNTLSLLSRQMIQQFLDELVWREIYGSTSSRAFDNIIAHIAEQTRIDFSESLLDRLAKIAANPFHNWTYSNVSPPPLIPLPIASKEDHQTGCDIIVQSNTVASGNSMNQPSQQSQQPILPLGTIPSFGQASKPGPKKGRKRNLAVAMLGTSANSPEPEAKKAMYDSKVTTNKDRDKENKADQISLQEFYYATMEGDKSLLLKEHKCSLYLKCFLCSTTMRTNTDVMEHMIIHVPPQVPGHSELPVCIYCCTAFSSQHQMVTHITEAHSNFGHSDSDMVVCAICEQKFGNSGLLINHMSSMHYPSEIPYRCESCGYRTSSHKDAIDHFYRVHEKGEGLQCPYCLKVIQFVSEGSPSVTSVHAFLLHMQRHVIRREQGRGNKCSRCCLWFNQKSSLKVHQKQLHDCVSNSKVVPYTSGSNGIMISKQRPPNRRFEIDSPITELPQDDKIKKWVTVPITVNVHLTAEHLSCQECEEDIEEQDHYPGEQRCQQCRYTTCCWRAFKEHQQQIHNERPMTSLVIPSPLINIPLEKRMQCACGYATTDGNQLATHLVKCKKVSAYPIEDAAPSGMLDSLGLVPKAVSEEASVEGKRTNSR